MKVVIRRVRTFYAEQMQAHGYGNRIFRFETDAQGEPMVHRVDGRHPESYYADDLGPVFDESEPVVAGDVNIRLIVIDNSTDRIIGSGGFGERLGKNSGYATVPGGFSFATAAHELGHAFGLEHDFRDGAYIMSYGPGWDRLSACSAEFLSVHPYFNPKTPIEDGPRPTVELISPRTYPAGSRNVPVQFQVNDSEGLHQVFLRGLYGLIACRGLDGEKSALVEFDYDGAWRVDGLLPLPNAVAHTFFGEAVDTDGNLSAHFVFTLVESSPHRIATLEGNTWWFHSVAFSPVDATLAAGSDDGTVKLWDVETQQDIGTLEGHTDGVRSVAFSSDGRTLASGSDDGTVKLWDVETQQDIGTLEGHTDGVRSVAFSSDGRTLASGSNDGTVKLWDVGSRELVGTLEAHKNGVISVAFSPDGATLASGSWDGTIKLWDMGSRELVGTPAGHRKGVSVAFSPDGAALASGSWDGTIKLWDVETQQDIGTLRGHTGEVLSVAFSPFDATLLASGSSNAEVKLWNAITGANLATFGNMSTVNSVAFSSDGATLASGTGEGTSELWDLSEWTGPRPYAVETISGDGQQGVPGAALAHPLVVEVRDQYGNHLPNAVVTFTVTMGDGTFSKTTATTDANGLATTTLTPGRKGGTVTVVATVGDLKPVTFTATAKSASDFDGDGTVGFGDFVQFAAQFGLSHDDERYDARYDLDGNGAIGFGDFLILAGAFGSDG